MAIKISGINIVDNSQHLRITGVSTFTVGPVFIGAATSTGTASQPLQVTGGAYVSGNLGIGTTNATSKLQVVGDTRVSGVVTAFDFYNDAEYPNIRPTLDLAFAQTKILDSRITFTRASTATYVNASGLIASAAVNEARFDHNPATGESLGLLVEEARTNLITYSEQFDNAAWTSNANVTSNTDTAPDGNLTADTYSSTGAQLQTSFISITQNTNYTASLFIKKTTGRAYTAGLYLIYDSGTLYTILFNTNDGTFSAITGANSPTVKSDNAGNYWRVSLTANSGSTVNVRFALYPNLNAVATAGTGQQVVWGAQLEAGAFPTSYIPTVASTVTRAADVASITGSNFSSWYNQAGGTIMYLYRTRQISAGAYSVLWELQNSGTRRLMGYHNGSGSNSFYGTYSPNGGGVISGGAVSNTNGLNIIASSFSLSSTTNTANSANPTTSSHTVIIPSDSILFGRGSDVPNTHCVARLAYYPVRLPDAQLQTITL